MSAGASPGKRREMDVMKLMMSDWKVELVNDNISEFNVLFKGPTDSASPPGYGSPPSVVLRAASRLRASRSSVRHRSLQRTSPTGKQTGDIPLIGWRCCATLRCRPHTLATVWVRRTGGHGRRKQRRFCS